MAAPSYYVETPDGQKVPFDVPAGASEAQIRTLAARALKQKLPDAKYQRPVLSKEASQSLLPPSARGELKADDTALSKVTGGVRSALGALGVGERYGAHLANRVTGALNDLTPVGDAVTASDARDDWRAGDYLGAIGNTALAGIGLIPGAGDLAAKGGKGAIKRGRSALEDLDDWLSGTKAVDAEGKPLTLYHGTPSMDFAADHNAPFSLSNVGDRTDYGNFGAGIYTTPQEWLARAYTNRTGDVIPVQAAVKNPLRIRVVGPEYTDEVERLARKLGVTEKPIWEGSGQKSRAFAEQFRERALAAGYDGVITENIDGTLGAEVVAYRPEQVRRVGR